MHCTSDTLTYWAYSYVLFCTCS